MGKETITREMDNNCIFMTSHMTLSVVPNYAILGHHENSMSSEAKKYLQTKFAKSMEKRPNSALFDTNRKLDKNMAKMLNL